MDFATLVQQYFIDPILYGTGYNIYNTLMYGILFVLFAFVIYKILGRMRVRINREFVIGILPYIVLGGILRALRDAEVVKGVLFVTPLIYFLILGISLTILIVSWIFQRKNYYKPWSFIGWAFCIFCLLWVDIVNWLGIALVTSVFLVWVIVFIAAKKISMNRFTNISNLLSRENLGIILAHCFDASTTFVSLQYFPYWEQHVLGGIAVNAFGPIGIFLMKIPILLLILYFLDKELPSKRERNNRTYIKIAILLLGLAPGLRNLLRLGMMV